MLNYIYSNFPLFDLAYFFIIYAFSGWILETVSASWEERRFINRGFLNGPFCPIYGFGALLLLVVLHPVINNLCLLFSGAIILTSLLEYLTGWILEKVFDHKWWDYSTRRFNLQGRICLRYSIYWGIAALVMLKVLHPEVIKLVDKIPYQYGRLGLYGISLYFLVDFLHTVLSVSELKAALTEMQHLAIEGRDRLEQIRESSVEGIEETGAEIRAQYNLLVNRMAARNRRLFNAFPNLKRKNYDHILKELKDRWNHISNQGSTND